MRNAARYPPADDAQPLGENWMATLVFTNYLSNLRRPDYVVSLSSRSARPSRDSSAAVSDSSS